MVNESLYLKDKFNILGPSACSRLPEMFGSAPWSAMGSRHSLTGQVVRPNVGSLGNSVACRHRRGLTFHSTCSFLKAKTQLLQGQTE